MLAVVTVRPRLCAEGPEAALQLRLDHIYAWEATADGNGFCLRLSEGDIQVIPTPSRVLGRISPVFPRFLRVFTVSTRRFQRATSRNPGTRNSRHRRSIRRKYRFSGRANSGCWERMADRRASGPYRARPKPFPAFSLLQKMASREVLDF